MTGRRYRDSEQVDFAIVGSGAAGAICARACTGRFSTVVLEQGPRLHRRTSSTMNSNTGSSAASPTSSTRIRRPSARSAKTAERVKSSPPRGTRATVGGSSVHFTANYWRFHDDRLQRAQPARRDPRHRLRRLADHLRGARAVLHEGRVGDRRVGPGRREPVRSAAHQAVPDAAAAGEVVGRAARTRRAQAGPASLSRRRWRSTRSRTAAARPACTAASARLRLRGAGEVVDAVTMIPEAEATGRCEVRAESYVVRIETDNAGRATGVALLRSRPARAVPEGARRRRVRQRRRDAAPAADVGERAVSRRARQLERLGRQEPDVQLRRAKRARVFEHELNEYKSVQVTRIVHDFYDSDPKRGFYGGGGLDARIGPQPIVVGAFAPRTEGRRGAARTRRCSRRFRARMIVAGARHVARRRANSITSIPTLKDAWGLPAMRVTYKDHPDDLANARFLQDRGVEIMQAAGALTRDEGAGRPSRRSRCTCSARAAWATTRRPRSSTDTTAATTSRTCSSATAAASSPPAAASRR